MSTVITSSFSKLVSLRFRRCGVRLRVPEANICTGSREGGGGFPLVVKLFGRHRVAGGVSALSRHKVDLLYDDSRAR